MKRLVYDRKKCCMVWSDWKPTITKEYGPSCVKKSKYVEDKVRINNNEVSTGSTRIALYTKQSNEYRYQHRRALYKGLYE